MPDPNQPRKEFEAESLRQLADSLQERGQLQPIRVRWDAAMERWVIIAGERRWRAAGLAGLPTITAVEATKPLTDDEILEEQLIENCVREDLRPIEQARAYKALIDSRGISQRQLAEKLRIAQATVAKTLALLKLPEEIQASVDASEIGPAEAYQLSRVDDPQEQVRMAREVTAGRLKRDEIEERVRATRKGRGIARGKAKKVTTRDLQDRRRTEGHRRIQEGPGQQLARRRAAGGPGACRAGDGQSPARPPERPPGTDGRFLGNHPRVVRRRFPRNRRCHGPSSLTDSRRIARGQSMADSSGIGDAPGSCNRASSESKDKILSASVDPMRLSNRAVSNRQAPGMNRDGSLRITISIGPWPDSNRRPKRTQTRKSAFRSLAFSSWKACSPVALTSTRLSSPWSFSINTSHAAPPYLAVHPGPKIRGAAAMTIDSLKIEGSGGNLMYLAAGSSSRSSRIVRKARTSAASSWRISWGIRGTLPLGEGRFRPPEGIPE